MNKWSIKLNLNVLWDDIVFSDFIGSFLEFVLLKDLLCFAHQSKCSFHRLLSIFHWLLYRKLLRYSGYIIPRGPDL